MKVGIFHDSEREELLKKICVESLEECEVMYFADKKELVEKYLAGDIEVVLLCSKYVMQKIKADCLELISLNVKKEDIYITPINTINRYQYKGRLASEKDIFVPIHDFVQIHGLNIHVADHCNLRCKACSHSAPLVGKEVFPDVETYKKDLKRLHEICENVCSIILLGGEPLLNPLLPEYIRTSREVYADAGIIIITNGTLLFKMDEELINTVREYGVKISVSVYPMMSKKAEEFEKFLQDKGLHYEISNCGQFEKKLAQQPYFNGKMMAEWCPECVVIRNGKISRCVMSMYIDYYNQFFHTEYPENEGIDLYREDLTGLKLMELLNESLQICAWCSKGYQVEMMDCEQIKGLAQIEDFVIK